MEHLNPIFVTLLGRSQLCLVYVNTVHVSNLHRWEPFSVREMKCVGRLQGGKWNTLWNLVDSSLASLRGINNMVQYVKTCRNSRKDKEVLAAGTTGGGLAAWPSSSIVGIYNKGNKGGQFPVFKTWYISVSPNVFFILRSTLNISYLILH